MATGVVLPSITKANEWHDPEYKPSHCPTKQDSLRVLSLQMARPPQGAEPKEDTSAHKPSLPPLHKFLSDAGHPDLFAQSRPGNFQGEPHPPNNFSSNNQVLQPNAFRASSSHLLPHVDSSSQPLQFHADITAGTVWPYPNVNPLPSQPALPGPIIVDPAVDRAPGPVAVRQEIIPGTGLCYIYEDGTICPTFGNGETINPKWGTTKAGKPRKRLGQACNTCREKKIKCDPNTPKCAQCQKFGRECKFDPMPRPGPRQAGSLPSTPPNLQLADTSQTTEEYDSRRGSTASTDMAPQEQLLLRDVPKSSMSLETLLSPTLVEEIKPDDGLDDRPPAKRPRVSDNPLPGPGGWLSEIPLAEVMGDSTVSPSAMSNFSWEADPYHVNRKLTLLYLSKYFDHVDGAAYGILPRNAFTQWVKRSSLKSPTDKMLLYAILAMGTVFGHRGESNAHRDIFIDIVHRAIMSNGDRFSLQLIQTKLILSLFTFSQGHSNQAWDLCGSAMRIALDLKFNTEEGVSLVENRSVLDFGLDYATLVECRRRTSWSIYILDCFNGYCSTSVTAINRAECKLRLPCGLAAYEAGDIPLTAFNLDPPSSHRDHPPDSAQGLSHVGLLGYLVEIASIFSEVVSKIRSTKANHATKDPPSSEPLYKTIIKRLDAWIKVSEKYLQQRHVGEESVCGLQILRHFTAMTLHRYVGCSENPHLLTSEYVRTAHDEARMILEMVQKPSNPKEKDESKFRFATLNPFNGFAVTAALDIITATVLVADLFSPQSQILALVAGGQEALERLADFWHSARRQNDMVDKRCRALISVTANRAKYSGVVYFGKRFQNTLCQDHDIIYALSRTSYLQALGWKALGWDDRIHQDTVTFHRLDDIDERV